MLVVAHWLAHRLVQDDIHLTNQGSQWNIPQVRCWHYKGLCQKASRSVKWSNLIFCLTTRTSVPVSFAIALQKTLDLGASSSSPYHSETPSFTTACCCHFSEASMCYIICYPSVHPRRSEMGLFRYHLFWFWRRFMASPLHFSQEAWLLASSSPKTFVHQKTFPFRFMSPFVFLFMQMIKSCSASYFMHVCYVLANMYFQCPICQGGANPSERSYCIKNVRMLTRRTLVSSNRW